MNGTRHNVGMMAVDALVSNFQPSSHFHHACSTSALLNSHQHLKTQSPSSQSLGPSFSLSDAPLHPHDISSTSNGADRGDSLCTFNIAEAASDTKDFKVHAVQETFTETQFSTTLPPNRALTNNSTFSASATPPVSSSSFQNHLTSNKIPFVSKSTCQSSGDVGSPSTTAIQIDWIKPKSFMNDCGRVISKAYQRFQPHLVLLIHDELDKEFGHLSIKKLKSSNGHNGLKSYTHFLPVSFLPLHQTLTIH